MDAPREVEIPRPRSLAQRLTDAAGDLDTLSKIALVCLVIAWFFADTLVVALGSIKSGVRFYDISAVIGDPSRLFFSIDTTFSVVAFGGLCIACVLLPLTPHFFRGRFTWFAYCAPLALIVTCAVLLYSRASSEFFTSPALPSGIGSKVVHFANSLVQHGGGLVARHVAVGLGGYLGTLCGLVLAIQGFRRFHTHHHPRRSLPEKIM
jgi:hypothetical protein